MTDPSNAVRAGVLLAFGLAVILVLGACSHAPETPVTPPPAAPHEDGAQTGLASYYATKFEGKRTASGAVYHRDSMTAAHRSLPFGTRVRVTRLATGKSVDVVVNDRGPFRKGRIVDLSRRAAEQLDLVRAGVARVRIDVLHDSAD